MAGHDVVGIGVVALAAVVSLVKLWLRLWFHLRNERERRRYLYTASALPPGSRVREQRDDGSQLTVTLGGKPRKRPDERRP